MLQIYNTLTRKKEIFKPINPGKISMYVCGITVYDYCHIGHARTSIAFDVVARFLRSQGWDLNYVHNITDIDDKIIRRANELNEKYDELTARFIDAMHDDEKRLGILPPSIEPRATEFIEPILELTNTLINKGHAYAASNGDVYYRVASFSEYGKLSDKNVDELLAGARIEVGDVKEDPRDFVLWKAAKAGEPSWPSPWGNGRPGWHIECSAMAKKCCGDHVDIHGGGADLQFPHHENEIAQSEAANGHHYVNYWMHVAPLRVDGEKMSKSLNNFFTIRDVLEKYQPEVVRFFLISSHYRSPINYSEFNLIQARSGLMRFYKALKQYSDVGLLSKEELQGSKYYQLFVDAMNDDFNTRIALASMYDLTREINSTKDRDVAKKLVMELKTLGNLLGILQLNPREYLQWGHPDQITRDEIEKKINARNNAKLEKNYQLADEIRADLKNNQIDLMDTKEGTDWEREVPLLLGDTPMPINELYLAYQIQIRVSNVLDNVPVYYKLKVELTREGLSVQHPFKERDLEQSDYEYLKEEQRSELEKVKQWLSSQL